VARNQESSPPGCPVASMTRRVFITSSKCFGRAKGRARLVTVRGAYEIRVLEPYGRDDSDGLGARSSRSSPRSVRRICTRRQAGRTAWLVSATR
jgi:hypothetical protein